MADFFEHSNNSWVEDKCGEIFRTSQNNFIIICTECQDKHCDFQEFAKHFREVHNFEETVFNENKLDIKDEEEKISQDFLRNNTITAPENADEKLPTKSKSRQKKSKRKCQKPKTPLFESIKLEQPCTILNAYNDVDDDEDFVEDKDLLQTDDAKYDEVNEENENSLKNKVSCKCRQECRMFSVTHRQNLFTLYYSKNKQGQLCFLSNLIDIVPVKRSRTYSDRRQISVSYRLPDEEGKFGAVCKKTFLETFGLKHQIVDTIVKKKKAGEQHTEEKRGGLRYRKYTETHKKLIHNFINSIPREENHHGSQDTSKEYISSDLNFSALHSEFVAKHPEANVERQFFITCFKKDFPSLSFKRPRLDACSVRKASDLGNYPLRPSSSKTITEEKKKNLKKMMESIPVDKRPFFDQFL